MQGRLDTGLIRFCGVLDWALLFEISLHFWSGYLALLRSAIDITIQHSQRTALRLFTARLHIRPNVCPLMNKRLQLALDRRRFIQVYPYRVAYLSFAYSIVIAS